MTAQVEQAVMMENSRGITTSFLVALTAAIAVIMFNALPAFLGGVAQTFAFDNTQLGTLVSSYFMGHTLMTLVAGLARRRLNLYLAALVAPLFTAACFLLMIVANSYQWLLITLFASGLGGGILFVIAMTVLASGERATRDIGICFLMQMILASIVVYVCPAMIIPQWGLEGILILFASLFVCAAALASIYKREDIVAVTMTAEGTTARHHFSFQLKPVVALFTLAVFFVGMTAMWAFMERIGNTSGFDPVFIGTVLMGSLLAGGLASLLTVVLENRVGIRIPIALSCAVIVLSLLLLANGGAEQQQLFAISVVGFQFSWVFAVNYIAASVAWLDKTGDHAPLLPAAMGIGVIIGPVVAGVISAQGFTPLMFMSIGIAILVMLVLGVSPLVKGVYQVKT